MLKETFYFCFKTFMQNIIKKKKIIELFLKIKLAKFGTKYINVSPLLFVDIYS